MSAGDHDESGGRPLLASVVISTYNRAGALPKTLAALAEQDIPTSSYEVIVVDDGSTDSTSSVLAATAMPYSLRCLRQTNNSGVAAGRNAGIRAAVGQYLVMISDDLIVPPNFLRLHIETHERFPRSWVVGGFSQLDDLGAAPFGRFLDGLEQSFDVSRLGPRIDDTTFEMGAPTARNLSMLRSDLDEIGLFDVQFRVTCEDHDLAERARQRGLRFLYNTSLECIHNDQSADLERYCRFQRSGARDTVRFCRKYPERHGAAAVITQNGYIEPSDGFRVKVRKTLKRAISTPILLGALTSAIRWAERRELPDPILARAYQLVIGAHIFAGVREELGSPSN